MEDARWFCRQSAKPMAETIEDLAPKIPRRLPPRNYEDLPKLMSIKRRDKYYRGNFTP